MLLGAGELGGAGFAGPVRGGSVQGVADDVLLDNGTGGAPGNAVLLDDGTGGTPGNALLLDDGTGGTAGNALANVSG